ncbi:MAG: 50S ribosomal protein L32 [Chlamydiae bacterium RIFCSPHIGHO2_12_FULL_27_8]|nr:MAG: 50S ribosomal protein L32 [Chlamydiae bacterium RIFCSPHIGHO2_12_FULL_27_8]OGN65428.1 MAG: 50S ribosomal protein L32 [Chlamydiae bacterium RIFCSPLOWO2_01_FULL_28_7]
MAVPRNRSSNAKKNSRSSHSALKPKNQTKCSNCGSKIMSHRACPKCGFYAKRQIIVKKEKKE